MKRERHPPTYHPTSDPRTRDTPHRLILTSQCARRCQLMPALLLRGFYSVLEAYPCTGCIPPGFCKTCTGRTPYPLKLVSLSAGTGASSPGKPQGYCNQCQSLAPLANALANATRVPETRLVSMALSLCVFLRISTQQRTLHHLVYHSYQWARSRAHSLMFLCMIASYLSLVWHCRVFILFSFYCKSFLLISLSHKLGHQTTEMRHLPTYCLLINITSYIDLQVT